MTNTFFVVYAYRRERGWDESGGLAGISCRECCIRERRKYVVVKKKRGKRKPDRRVNRIGCSLYSCKLPACFCVKLFYFFFFSSSPLYIRFLTPSTSPPEVLLSFVNRPLWPSSHRRPTFNI